MAIPPRKQRLRPYSVDAFYRYATELGISRDDFVRHHFLDDFGRYSMGSLELAVAFVTSYGGNLPAARQQLQRLQEGSAENFRRAVEQDLTYDLSGLTDDALKTYMAGIALLLMQLRSYFLGNDFAKRMAA
jgi:hypothetical protein